MKSTKEDREQNPKAFTLSELLIAMACLLILAAIVLPQFARPPHVCKLNCTNNLRQIGVAIRTWALDNNDQFPMQVSVSNGGAMELVQTAWSSLCSRLCPMN